VEGQGGACPQNVCSSKREKFSSPKRNGCHGKEEVSFSVCRGILEDRHHCFYVSMGEKKKPFVRGDSRIPKRGPETGSSGLAQRPKLVERLVATIVMKTEKLSYMLADLREGEKVSYNL